MVVVSHVGNLPLVMCVLVLVTTAMVNAQPNLFDLVPVLECRPFAFPCTESTQCCSKICELSHLNQCDRPVCAATGVACSTDVGGARCCSGYDECVGGACQKKCAIRGVGCNGTLPCCHQTTTDRCLAGQCQACRNNGASCTTASECCWPGSQCTNGKCQGCLELGRLAFGLECQTNADCCSGECGNALPRICGIVDTSCTAETKSCMASPNSCCEGLTCGYVDNGAGGAWKYCYSAT